MSRRRIGRVANGGGGGVAIGLAGAGFLAGTVAGAGAALDGTTLGTPADAADGGAASV